MLIQWWRQVTESPYQYALSKHSAGKLMSVLYLAAGLLTCASPLFPHPQGSDQEPIVWIGAFAAILGTSFWFIPWMKIPRWVMVTGSFVIANVLIATHNYYALDPYLYCVYFTVCYIWIGLTQRQGISFALIPVTVAAYVIPLVALNSGRVALYSTAYMMPMMVVLGESLAWISHRLAAAKKRLEYMAYHDSLTGLFNRAYFHQLMEDVLQRTDMKDTLTLVLLVDLNDFKSVNDQYGHGSGDMLLRETAAALERSTHGHGIWARLGGDEFGCIVTELGSLDAARRFAHMVREALEVPIEVDHVSFRVGASIGFAIAPNHGSTTKQVLRHADTAVYLDKSQPTSVNTHIVVQTT